MSNAEKNTVYNPIAQEHRGGGYRALEADAVERSVAEYIRDQEQEERMEEAGFDPRVVATIAEAETNQFDMQEGHYYMLE